MAIPVLFVKKIAKKVEIYHMPPSDVCYNGSTIFLVKEVLPMKKLQIGVIGCGTIANAAHIPSYMHNDGVQIKYFCDIIPERAQAAVEKYGVGTAVTDYHDVINDPEIDGVSVCTPNAVHSVIAIDALKAGKHVLCEKPAARIYSEALAMQQAQHETGKILNIGVVNRFNNAVNMIKDLADAGELGNIYHVYVSFRAHRSIPGLGGPFTTKAIAGGGALIDWGVHYLDIVMYVLGDPKPLTASGQAYSVLGKNMRDYVYEDMWAGPPDYDGTYDVDDFVTGLIRTEGPTISLNGAWAQKIGVKDTFIDFLGDKAGIRLTYGGDFTVYGVKDGKLSEEKPQIVVPEGLSEDMFQNEINAFVDNIRQGGKIRSCIDRAVLTSQIMQGLYDSSDAHREIVFDK